LKFFKGATIYILIIVMAIFLIKLTTPPVIKEVGMDYNAFKRAVVEDQVKDVAAVIEDNTIKYTVTMKDDKKHEVIGLGTDPPTYGGFVFPRSSLPRRRASETSMVGGITFHNASHSRHRSFVLLYDATKPGWWQSGDAVWEKQSTTCRRR